MGDDEWTRANRAREDLDRARNLDGSRLTDRVEFVFGVEGMEDIPDELTTEAAAQVGREVIGPTADDDLRLGPLTFRWEGLGRGAEGLAVAATLAWVLFSLTYVLNSINTWVEAARNVAELWRRVRKSTSTPVLSLGAIVCLCTVDLVERLGNVDEVMLLWAGDVSGAHDITYSGDDLLLVLFVRGNALWTYTVDSYGRLVHFGEGSLDLRSRLVLNQGGEGPPPAAGESPPFLLGNSPD